jgi:hypothetical protein
VFVNKTLSPGKIDDAFERFHGEGNNASKPRLLIATTSSFGVGLTFSEAIGLCLLEPDFRLDVMFQVFGRHCRQGNKNLKTWCWLLLTSQNGVEERIMSVNKMRARIQESTEARVARGDQVILVEDED